MRWSWVFVAFVVAFLLGALAAALTAQEVVRDSVTVTVVERPVVVIMEGPQMAYRGDVLTYQAVALDQNGQPTPSFLVWSVSDTSKATLQVVSDSTARVTMRATGTFHIRVEVGPLDSLRVGMLDSLGVLKLPEDYPDRALPLRVVKDTATGEVVYREQRQLCALFFSGSEVWAWSPGDCIVPWMTRVGAYNPPHGPLTPLTVYGLPRQLWPSGPMVLAYLDRLIRAATPAARMTLGRVT